MVRWLGRCSGNHGWDGCPPAPSHHLPPTKKNNNNSHKHVKTKTMAELLRDGETNDGTNEHRRDEDKAMVEVEEGREEHARPSTSQGGKEPALEGSTHVPSTEPSAKRTKRKRERVQRNQEVQTRTRNRRRKDGDANNAGEEGTDRKRTPHPVERVDGILLEDGAEGRPMPPSTFDAETPRTPAIHGQTTGNSLPAEEGKTDANDRTQELPEIASFRNAQQEVPEASTGIASAPSRCGKNGLLIQGMRGIDLNMPLPLQEPDCVPDTPSCQNLLDAKGNDADPIDPSTPCPRILQVHEPSTEPEPESERSLAKVGDVHGKLAKGRSNVAAPQTRQKRRHTRTESQDINNTSMIQSKPQGEEGHIHVALDRAPDTKQQNNLPNTEKARDSAPLRDLRTHRVGKETSDSIKVTSRKNRRCVSRPTRKSSDAVGGSVLAAELVEAFRRFDKERKSRIVLSEWPLKKLNPWAMVGRWIASTWDEDLFYVGRIVCYESWTRSNLIEYLDGDEEFSIPSKRVRYIIFTYPGEVLPLHPKLQAGGGHVALSTKNGGYAPGEVIWLHASGSHPWPALVISPLDLLNSGFVDQDGAEENQSGVCARCFGSYKYRALRRGECSSFMDGIPVACSRSPADSTSFSLAIQETLAYLQQGDLPKSMLPNNLERLEEWLPVVTADPKKLSEFVAVRMTKEEVKSRLEKQREERVQEREQKQTQKEGTQVALPSRKGSAQSKEAHALKKKRTDGLSQGIKPRGHKDFASKDKTDTKACPSLPCSKAKSFAQVEYNQLPWNCYVCNEWEEYEENMLLDCSKCGTLVHMHCYGVSENPNGGLWLCDLCKEGVEETPPCALCPVTNGRAMKRTSCGRWVHSACAMWIPEAYYNDPERMDVVSGLDRIPKVRFQLQCGVCKVPYGACLQCDRPQCYNSYHVLCARHRGFRMEFLETFDEHTEELTRISMCRRHSPLAPQEPTPGRAGRWEQAMHPGSLERESQGWEEGCSRAHAFSGRTVGRRAQVGASKRTFLCSLPYVIHGGMKLGQPALPHGVRRRGTVLSGGRSVPRDVEVLTNKEKMEMMRITHGRRITIGKSAIHGWGAFCKVPHRKGDLVVEYVGGIARSVICDLRESRDYRSLVGAGTYLFKVTHEFAVDATRCGNIAHLINHSCEPNCYSRVLKVDSTEHIVIVASRDIEAGEELTYDYRFSSDEDLQCNCGAATCRGTVNFDGMSKDYFTAPAVELVPLRQARRVSGT